MTKQWYLINRHTLAVLAICKTCDEARDENTRIQRETREAMPHNTFACIPTTIVIARDEQEAIIIVRRNIAVCAQNPSCLA